MTLVLVAFLALRYHVGWDYWWYYDEITNVSTKGSFMYRDLGVVWTYLFSLSKWNKLYWLPISLVGVVTIILVYSSLKLILKKDDLIKSALLFFAFYPEFYLATFSIIRQFFALSLCVFVSSLCLSKDKNKILYLLLFISTVLFSSTFLHGSSAVCFGFILVFYQVKYVKKIWFISILLVLILTLFYLLVFFVESYFSEYEEYISGMIEGSYGKMLQIVYLLVFVLALFNVKSIGQKSKINIFFIIYVISVVLSSMILFTMNASYANRISLYFMIAILFVIPFVIQNCQNTIKISKILFAGFMACIFLLFLYIISSVNTLGMDNYIPYKTIFSE